MCLKRMKNAKFNLNVSACFFYIILIVSFFFISLLDRGFNTTDESYSLLYSLYNKDVIGKITNFGLIGNILLVIVNFDLYWYRILGFFLILVCSLISLKCLFIFYKSKNFDIFSDKYLFYSLVIAGSLCFYRFWVVTPSYNLFNFCGALIFLSGLLIFLDNSTILKNYKSIVLISSGLLICFISKPSTSIFLSITLLFWFFFMHRESFLKFIIFLSLFGVLTFF